MKIQPGYLYHIKDEFFYIVDDKTLMQNHERGKQRPTYFTIRDNGILWFIPLSSKVDKYQKIIDKKITRYGFCNTILIREIMGVDHAILLQNAFPTLEEYIDHVHKVNEIPAKVIDKLKNEITRDFKKLLKLKEKNINVFYTDIDKIMRKLEELKLKT
ncbi:MAG: hypothetical protein IJO33_03180 [Bacilli bacterium]|nr:hypothetical protein [Bacilli bacterium]